MTKLMRAVVFILMLIAPGIALGGGVATGVRVIQVKPQDHGSGIAIVKFGGEIAGERPCYIDENDATRNSMVIDLNKHWGRSAFALVLSAQLAGHPVHVVGKGTCDLFTGMEDMESIAIGN